MPFESTAQRAWMFANKPSMAKRWAAHTPKGKKLPRHVKKSQVNDNFLGWVQDIRRSPDFNMEMRGTIPVSSIAGPWFKKADNVMSFKAGFLMRALEDGLGPDEIVKRAETACAELEKSANPFMDALGGVGKAVGLDALGGVGAGLISAPLFVGGIGGGLAGKLQNYSDQSDAGTLKLENRLMQYRRLAEEAQRQAKLKKLQEQHPGQVVPLD